MQYLQGLNVKGYLNRWSVVGLAVFSMTTGWSSITLGQPEHDDPVVEPYQPPPYYPPVDETAADQQIECKEVHPDRDGLTLRASMGGGFTALLYDEGDSQSYPGWNVLNLGVGTFFSPQLALLLDGSFVWFGSFSYALENGFVASLGPTIQWWFLDWLSVEGGVGLGVNYIEFRNGPSFTQYGPQFGAGLNLNLYSGENNAVGLYTKAMMVPSRDSTLSWQIGVAWQMF